MTLAWELTDEWKPDKAEKRVGHGSICLKSPHPRRAETGRSRVWDRSELHNELLSKTKKINKKKGKSTEGKKIPSAENCQKESHSCHKHDSMKSGVWKNNVYRTKGKWSFSIQGKKDPGKQSPRKAVLKEDSKRRLFVPCL